MSVRKSKPAIRAIPDLASIMDAVGLRLRAIRQHVPQLRQLHIAVLFHEPGDVVAAASAAVRAFDRQG
jgi:hypothetical protein